MILPDTAPWSVGFILSCGEGHELSKDEQIQVCANKVKSRLEPAEHAGRQRTKAVFRVVQKRFKLLTTKSGV